MFRTLRSWLRGSSKKKSLAGRRTAASLRLVPLEDRSLLSASFGVDSLINTFNTGISSALNNSVVRAVVHNFDADLPVLKEKISDVTGLASQFTKSFAETLTGTAATSLADLRNQLNHPEQGFILTQLDQTPNANGNLVELEYKKDIPLNVAFSVGDKTDFSYFDNFVNGSLAGNVVAGATTLHVDLKYGVDVVNNAPAFFVSDASKITLDNITLSGAVSGELAIRSLADVTVNGKVSGGLQGSVTLTDNDGVADHKVRIAGLASSIVPTATGNLSLTFDGTKDAQGKTVAIIANFPVLGQIEIDGKLGATLNNTSLTFTDTLASKTSATDLIRAAANNVLSLFGGNNLPILGNTNDTSTNPTSSTNLKTLLSQPLPLTGGKTILDELGLSSAQDLKFLFTPQNALPATASLTDIQAALTPLGIQLLPGKSLADADSVINSLIHGDKVDLIHFRKEGSLSFADNGTVGQFTTELFPGVTGTVSLNLGANVHAGYKVGLGFDTTGFYIDPDTSLQIGGGVNISVSGSVSALSLVGLTASASLGVSADAGIKFYDPDPTDGKIYYDEIFNTDKSQSTINNFLNSMEFYAQAQVQGDVKVSLQLPLVPDVTLFEKQFTGDALFSTSQDNHITTASGNNTFRKIPLVPTNPISVDSFVTTVNGQNILTINDSAATSPSNVHLGPGANGTVNVILFGRGVGTTTAKIDKIVYVGSKFNDRLDVDPTLTVPINAQGGAGDDYLSGGAGNDTLNGGDGNDTIFGNGGNDTITGDAGVNVLHGGAGNDSLTAGAGGDTVAGDDGDDTITGGAGHDVLTGGTGNDTITGGDGDQLLGGDGNDTLTGTTGAAFFDGGAGNDTVTGGAGNDTITGGDGSDLLFGGAGDDVIDGGAGDDHIEGGAGNDTLRGGVGNDLILGNDGNDRISGGAGSDTLFGDDQAGAGAQSGQDTFVIDFADGGTALDTISGGPDRDAIAIVGQTTLDSTGKPVSFDDDILISPGPTPGSTTAGYRPLGSTAAYQQVTFSLTNQSDLISGVDSIRVEGGAGNDRIELAQNLTTPVIVDGGDGDDTILGSDGNDTLYGGAGNDTIDGRGGADTIYGDGDGVLVTVAAAQEGKDTLHGGAGQDLIFGGGNDDVIDGGADADVIHGGAGNDVLMAGNDIGDTLFGDDGNDTLLGGDAPDELHGGAGDDRILGGDGSDLIFGDDGNDTIDGEFGRDQIFGGAGNDTLRAYFNNADREAIASDLQSRGITVSLPDLTTPTAAQDNARLASLDAEEQSIVADPYYQQLLTLKASGSLTPQQTTDLTHFENRRAVINDLQDDLFRLNTTKIDRVNGDAGDDTLYGSPYMDAFDGGAGNDTVVQSDPSEFGIQVADSIADSGPATDNDAFELFGTSVDDQISFRYESDGNLTVLGNNNVVLGHYGATAAGIAFNGIESLTIDAGAGNDTIDFTGLGNKVPLTGQIKVLGGAGNDTINASTYQGKTYLDGGDGNDTITGGAIADTILGGTGDDTINGGNGDNVIDGGDGNDRITAGVGNDTITGGAGNDVISAGDGNDYVDAGDGNDYVDGGAGNDTLHGGAGDDRILGGSGNDFIYGEAGNDLLYGMSGNDYVNGGDGNDNVNGDGVLAVSGGADGILILSDNLASDGNDTLVGGLGADLVNGDGGNDLLDNSPNATADMSADVLDGGVGTDTVLVSFKNRQTWTRAETVTIVNPTGGKTYLAADQSLYGLENGTVWSNGQAVRTAARDFGVNTRNELYVLTTFNTLIKYTRDASGAYTTATVVHTGVQTFNGFDASGNPHYTLFPAV